MGWYYSTAAKLVAIPVKQEVRPLERFQVTCRSTSPRQIPSARIPLTGVLVEQDPRFVVTRPRPEEMVIIAPEGLAQHNKAILIEWVKLRNSWMKIWSYGR